MTEINWVRMMQSDSKLSKFFSTYSRNKDDHRHQLRRAINRNAKLHCRDFGVSDTDSSDCNHFIYRVTFRQSKKVSLQTSLH